MKLYAISDLHLAHPVNREMLLGLPVLADDWLIVAGDVGETDQHLHYAWRVLTKRFAKVFWVPGNHDLYTHPNKVGYPRGVAKYEWLVDVCREYGVVTPEDSYVLWPGAGGPHLIVPTFTLYDYSFRPGHVPLERAVDWAFETEIICTDEFVLHPDPYPTRMAWCAARVRYTEERLDGLADNIPLIVVNHNPLREDLIRIHYKRFSIWCGTKKTEEWHTRYPIKTVIYGHLHRRGTYHRDGVRFEEVSLGYPKNWEQGRGVVGYLRQILP